MSTGQPPSDGDRPAEGQETAAETAAPAKRTPRRTPAATTEGAATTPKRVPAPRKRPAAKTAPMSPTGEAPEILDAMLGKGGAESEAKAAPAAEPAKSPARTAAEATPSAEPATTPSAEPAKSRARAAAKATPSTEAAETSAASAAEVADVSATAATRAEKVSVSAATPEVVGAEEGPADSAPAAADGTTVLPEATPPTAEPHPDHPDHAGAHYRSVNDIADRLDDSRFFSTLFDFSFTSYVTRKLAGPVYVVGLVLIGLGIVVGFANSLGIAIAANSPGGAFVFLLGILVTLVAAILSVLLLRVTIEVFCAIIEIAQNTRRKPPRR